MSINLIPKIIHQTYPSEINNDKIKNNILHLQTLNPGYEYILYNDSDIIDFIHDNYGLDILKEYNRISNKYTAAKADLFRYLLMYKKGGIYLDIKSSANIPFDNIIKTDDTYLVTSRDIHKNLMHKDYKYHPYGLMQQWSIINSPKHGFLEKIINNVLSNIKKYNHIAHGVGRHGVFKLSGPDIYTSTISSLLSTYKYRYIGDPSKIGLVYSILEGSEHTKLFTSHYNKQNTPIINH